jgi:6,7-dimethyl-8-ribityllumazine synthase
MKTKKIAIIQSEYYESITAALTSDAQTYLQEHHFNSISIYKVPGAVEIPLAALWCAKQGYDGIIVFGCVIQGQTKHFDFVCEQVNQGCQRVMMDHAKPVIFGVLTTYNEEQARARVVGPVSQTGVDCAKALIQMFHLKEDITYSPVK